MAQIKDKFMFMNYFKGHKIVISTVIHKDVLDDI